MDVLLFIGSNFVDIILCQLDVLDCCHYFFFYKVHNTSGFKLTKVLCVFHCFKSQIGGYSTNFQVKKIYWSTLLSEIAVDRVVQKKVQTCHIFNPKVLKGTLCGYIEAFN